MRVASLVVVVGLIGCAGSQPRVQDVATAMPSTPPAEASALTIEKSADSGTVDKVGASDGALAPDGINDLVFFAKAEGPVSALFLVGVDESGKPSGTFQADTLIGDAESPAELGAKPGNGTSGLGMFEGDKVLNAKDGTLQDVGAGPHSLMIYVAASPAAPTGTRLRVYAQRPDKTLIAGNTVTN